MARSNVNKCHDFRETADVLAKVHFLNILVTDCANYKQYLHTCLLTGTGDLINGIMSLKLIFCCLVMVISV